MEGDARVLMESRTERTKRNIVWGMAGRIVALLGPFVVRSLLVARLGADYLGLASFYTSLLQVLNLAELGFSTAVAYGMYRPIADADTTEVARYLAYLKGVYRVVGAGIIVLGMCLAPALSVLGSGAVPTDVNLQLAFFLYVVNTAAGYFLFAHKATLLTALQRKDVVDKVGLAVTSAQFALQAAVLVGAPSFYAYALVLPLCSIAGSVAVSKAADRMYPEYANANLRALRLSAEDRASMRTRVAGLVVQKASMVTRDSFATVVVSAFAGLLAVARFSNYLVVISGVLGILSVFASSMTAAVGNSVARESRQKNYGDLRVFVGLYASLSIVCAAVLLAVYQPFMVLWVGEEMLEPFGFAVLMVAYFYVRTMGDIRTVYVDATGVWWDLRWRAVAETAVNVVLAVVLVRALSETGAAIALVASLFSVNFLYGSHLVFKLYFGSGLARGYYADHALYAAVGVVVCAVTYAIASFVPDGGWLFLCVKLVVAGCVSLGSTALLLLPNKRFAAAVAFAKKALSRKA